MSSEVRQFDWGRAMHAAAEKHLERVWRFYAACEEGETPDEADDVAAGPFCGCDTCVIRETLAGAWPVIESYAQDTTLQHNARLSGR